MRAIAEIERSYTGAEVAAVLADRLNVGMVYFSVWSPRGPWHGSTLTYPAGGDWRGAYRRCLQAYVDAIVGKEVHG